MKEGTKNAEEEKRTERREEVWSFSHFFALLLKDFLSLFVILFSASCSSVLVWFVKSLKDKRKQHWESVRRLSASC